MARITLPPGCTGLDMADGTRYHPRHGTDVVDVADRHASAIRRGYYGHSGLMAADEPHQLGTKGTRWCQCAPGGRAWNSWTYTCPRCGAPTTTTKDKA